MLVCTVWKLYRQSVFYCITGAVKAEIRLYFDYDLIVDNLCIFENWNLLTECGYIDLVC